MVRTLLVTPYATFSLVSGLLPATTSLGVSYMTAVACDSPTTLHIYKKGHAILYSAAVVYQDMVVVYIPYNVTMRVSHTNT